MPATKRKPATFVDRIRRAEQTRGRKEGRALVAMFKAAFALPAPRSWRPEMLVDGKWYPNGQRFATESEARRSAHARFMAWTQPTDFRAFPSDDPVNYRRGDNGDERIEE
jgi:hypothetical protein